MENIDNATRQQVAEFLPAAIEKALGSYRTFMAQDVDNKPKNFSDHHKAGKVAISHVELLIKLAEWAGIDKGDQMEKLGEIIGHAKYEVKDFQTDNDGFSKEDPAAENNDDINDDLA